VGRPDTVAAGCGAAGGPDAAYPFTAPEDGSYRFDTPGSSFDTILHVHAGVCVAPEIACNDDSGGLQSRVTVSLVADQTVSVVVDGFGTSAGSYTLNVSR
jgi:hypothetical protein